MTFHWETLLRTACSLIDQVNQEHPLIDHWTFGGGTAMMLQIDHRDSHDVDIFLDDPQLLPFLDPAKRDFKFEIAPTVYLGDGAGSLKIVFDGIGEIDFIASTNMTSQPAAMRNILGRDVMLETIPEIITKKVFYRGSSITPRDIFDIAAGGRDHGIEIAAALRQYRPTVERTITQIKQGNAHYIYTAISKLQVHCEFENLKSNAISVALAVLEQALE